MVLATESNENRKSGGVTLESGAALAGKSRTAPRSRRRRCARLAAFLRVRRETETMHVTSNAQYSPYEGPPATPGLAGRTARGLVSVAPTSPELQIVFAIIMLRVKGLLYSGTSCSLRILGGHERPRALSSGVSNSLRASLRFLRIYQNSEWRRPSISL